MRAANNLEFRILGPLEVRRLGEPIDLGGAKQRALLGVLLLNVNKVVPVENRGIEAGLPEPFTVGKSSTALPTILSRSAERLNVRSSSYRL